MSLSVVLPRHPWGSPFSSVLDLTPWCRIVALWPSIAENGIIR